MIHYIEYFKYILNHKKNVFKACWERGLYLHAFTHDMSKFSLSEFAPYAEYFYGDFGVKNKCPAKWMELKCHQVKAEFEKAWKHHYDNNPHHWEHWLDENGKPKIIPDKYIRQMAADWEGMSLKFGGSAQFYYLTNYDDIKLERTTRITLESYLGLNYSEECYRKNYKKLSKNFSKYHIDLTLKELASVYNENTFNKYYGYIKDKYGIDAFNKLRA